MKWSPATIEDVRKVLKRDLAACTAQQLQEFWKHATEPYFAPLVRYGALEQVVIVARKNDEVIYWEDVEAGFNLSPITSDGTIREHHCNQDPISVALDDWIVSAIRVREASQRLMEVGGSAPDMEYIPRRRPL